MAVTLLISISPLELRAFSDDILNLPIDWRVIAFTVAATGAAGLLFAVGPALRLSRVAAGWAHTRTTADSGRRHGLNALVAVQIAVTLTLVASASLMMRSFVRLRGLEVGFRPAGLVAAELNLPADLYAAHDQRVAFVDELADRVRRLPHVASTGVTTNVPLTPNSWNTLFRCEGRPPGSASERLLTADRVVTPGYLETLGVTLVAGRTITRSDTSGAARVVVISEALARTCWPGEDPLGRRVGRATLQGNEPWMTVVGVVADVKEDRGAFRRDRAAWYVPFAQRDGVRPVYLTIRTKGETATLAADVRAIVRDIDPRQPMASLGPIGSHFAGLMAGDRFGAVIMTAFSVMALCLAGVGLFGLVSVVAGRRTREIGVRLALGAGPSQIALAVLGDAMTPTAAGIACGLADAFAATRLLSSVMFAPNALDWAVPVGAAALVAAVSLVASLLPVRRAMNIDPSAALRAD